MTMRLLFIAGLSLSGLASCSRSSSSPFGPSGPNIDNVQGATVDLAVPQGTTRTAILTIDYRTVPTSTPLFWVKSNLAAMRNSDPAVIFESEQGILVTVPARTFTTDASHVAKVNVTVPVGVTLGTTLTASLSVSRTDVETAPGLAGVRVTVTAP